MTINVRDFGATGDGVTDDTAALQEALDAVDPHTGMMTVIIPDGTYMIQGVNNGDMTQWGQSGNSPQNRWIGGGIHPRAGTHLTLTPGAVLKIIPNSSPAYSAVFLGTGQDGVTIEGGRIIGDRTEHDFTTSPTRRTHEWGFGISTRGAKNITIQGVGITGCTGDCIYISSQGLLNLDSSTYHPSTHIRVQDCTLDGARRNNISVTGAEHVIIDGNTITRAGHHDGHWDGVAPRYGIDLEGYGEGDVDYEVVENVVIRNNVFKDNVHAAVGNFNGYGVVITQNHSDGPINFGYATDTVITGNVVKNPGNTTGNAIMSNEFVGGMGNYPARSLVSGNVVVGFSSGISVRRANVLVSGNLVTGFQRSGIITYGAHGATVTGNRVADGAPGARGVRVGGYSTRVHVMHNDVSNVDTGVIVDTYATEALIDGNTITSVDIGVNVKGGCQAVVTGNTFHLTGKGKAGAVRTAGSSAVYTAGNTTI